MNGNPLGLCSIALRSLPIEDVLCTARDAGFDGIELTARPPHFDPERGVAAAEEVARLAATERLTIIAYGSYLGHAPLVTPAHAEREVAIAAALGAPLLRVWAAAPEFDANVALLRACADAAVPHNVTVVIERHAGSFADTPERIEALLDTIDRENVALNYQPLDDMRGHDAALALQDCEGLIPHSRYMHVKNYHAPPSPDRPVRPFAPIDRGILDWRAILERALALGYEGPISLEFTGAAEPEAADEASRAHPLLRSWTQRLRD